MDMTALKAKAKEMKDQTVDFVRNNWKELLMGTITVVALLYQSSDDENENAFDEDYDHFDSNSYIETDESRDGQKIDPPKRFIGEIDATGSRLKENEKQFLEAFSAQYDRFRGIEQTVESKYTGWSSDGRYTRNTKTKHSFGNDKMSITVDESYKDDDGQTGSSSSPVDLKARKLINYIKENRNLEMFDDVRDIVDPL